MRTILLIGAATIALGLGACDAGPAAVTKAPQASTQAGASTAAQGGAQIAAADPRDAPTPLATDGKPMWAANRKHTAQENADYQFNKNAKDFGAATEADYVARVHAFIDSPPPGVKRIARSNGDALLYDAKTNTFVVVTRAGAPRTMFKPRDGAAYWQQQVAREQARSSKSTADDSES